MPLAATTTALTSAGLALAASCGPHFATCVGIVLVGNAAGPPFYDYVVSPAVVEPVVTTFDTIVVGAAEDLAKRSSPGRGWPFCFIEFQC